MSTPHKITQFFKRPSFALGSRDIPVENPNEPSTLALQSSPLTEPPSSFLSNDTTPQTPNGPASLLKDALLQSVNDQPETQSSQVLPDNFLHTKHASDPPSSLNTSQRIVKDGKEVVISSDGEDSDSIASIEAPDALFMRAAQPDSVLEGGEKEATGRTLRSRRSKENTQPVRSKPGRSNAPSYKHTLERLVTQAVDDNETEAGIAKFKAALEKKSSNTGAASGQKLDEGILTSALGEQDDELGLQRLLDAVRRTEAFDLEKAWFFFDYRRDLGPPLEFPQECVTPGTYLSSLRDSDSRERVLQSGVVDFALARGFLPDELVIWFFTSVHLEPKDALRHAYCRAFKSTPANRIKSLIKPDHVNYIFQQLGASTKGLAVHEPVAPDPLPKDDRLQGASQHHRALLSVLDLFCGAAKLFADDTRELIINILFRLTLDVVLTSNPTVCSELDKTIIAMLESLPDDTTGDDLERRICTTAYNTIKDPVIQSRLLRHILPTPSWIAALRSRLALAFLVGDPSLLDEIPDVMVHLKRVIEVLKEKRFDIRHYKRKEIEYDYGELTAITALINIVIDSGWSGMDFANKDAEHEFNSEVDKLSDRIKKIFTSIEDSGASHLKRTLAKEGLEALHYRIVYSVRSKPVPRRTAFGEREHADKTQATLKYERKPTAEAMPVRVHEKP
ncbi:hypothetical protein FE257_011874 [Aspergillus nanangensis]|uniref:Uncharacterized protein n=1 Tax=Aspergillus nanangensis TaxID=2582783 RepID=A0AAD4CGV4_ASPNN|nr:hypothetical protein FE257_011874 [Aspergillus nanangensis]